MKSTVDNIKINKCKFFNRVPCNKKKDDICEVEKFLGKFVIYLGDTEEKEYQFLCCPDKYYDKNLLKNKENTPKEPDLIIIDPDEDNSYIAIEAKTIGFQHSIEMQRLIKIVEKELSKRKINLEKSGITIEFNESIIHFASVIYNHNLLDKFCAKISNEILRLENRDEEILHLCCTKEKEILDYDNKLEILNFKKLSTKAKKQMDNLISVCKKSYEQRQMLLEIYQQKNIKTNTYVDNLFAYHYSVIKSLSKSKKDIIFKIKRKKDIGMSTTNLLQLNEIMVTNIIGYFEDTNKKFKNLKSENPNSNIKTILFFNRDFESDNSIFDQDGKLITELIEKDICKCPYIDEVWIENYEKYFYDENFDSIKIKSLRNKIYIKLYPHIK